MRLRSRKPVPASPDALKGIAQKYLQYVVLAASALVLDSVGIDHLVRTCLVVAKAARRTGVV
jgi:hypothetical protein